MSNKYMVKPNLYLDGAKIEHYDQVCLRCGATRVYTHVISPNGPPRPRPNTTSYLSSGNRISCMLGSHQWYFKDEVKLNT